jgi:hypothetical protein
MASDTLRYSLVENFGGVYADLNYRLTRDVTAETHKYNFFTKAYGSYYIENHFFAASAHHPVVEKMLELVERNIIISPKYLAMIGNQDSRIITDRGTANPTFLAYYQAANKGGNIDVVFPLTYKMEQVDIISKFIEYEQKISEIKYHICPEEKLYKDFTSYLEAHEISGTEVHNIGEDSMDGGTWLT